VWTEELGKLSFHLESIRTLSNLLRMGRGGLHVTPSELSIKEWDFLQRKIPYVVIEKIFINSHVERATLQRGAN
jgi:hypothetical protein